MANFISKAWDDITGVTAAGEASAAMTAATEQATGLGQKQLAFMQEQAAKDEARWAEQQAAVAPYQEAGLAALSRYQGITSGEEDISQDPALQYLQQQGQEQVESSAAARGTQLSGRTLEGLAKTGQGIASQYRGQILGELSGLMGMGSGLGMQATAGASGAGLGYSQGVAGGYGNLANLAMQGGQIQAANIMGAYQGASNIISGGLQAYGASK